MMRCTSRGSQKLGALWPCVWDSGRGWPAKNTPLPHVLTRRCWSNGISVPPEKCGPSHPPFHYYSKVITLIDRVLHVWFHSDPNIVLIWLIRFCSCQWCVDVCTILRPSVDLLIMSSCRAFIYDHVTVYPNVKRWIIAFAFCRRW